MAAFTIIGNGVAGTTAAEQIRERDQEGAIRIITNEDFPFYYRIRLNEYLAGDIGEDKLRAKGDDWYSAQHIKLDLDTRVVGGDPRRKFITTESGEQIPYDKLLIATGSHSFIPPITGAETRGVFALRSLQDARDIRAYAEGIKDAVIIGGGLLGLEAGHALIKLGKRVTVVEFFPRLLPRQLDTEGAQRLQRMMEGMGFSFRLGAKTESISGDRRANEVLLAGGERLPAEMVIVSAGVRPNIELAKHLDLDADKGIKVNDRLCTSGPDIYAAGDVAEFRGMPYGIWPAAMEQGRIAGANMAGEDMVYSGTTMANSLKVVGIDLASAGNIDADGELSAKVVADEATYKKIVLEDKHIVGCIMLGDTTGFNRITKAISHKTEVTDSGDESIAMFFK